MNGAPLTLAEYVTTLTVAQLEELSTGVAGDAVVIAELRRRDAERERADRAAEVAAEVAYGALLEVGRRDLADLVMFHLDDDGTPYLEPMDDVAGADLELMVRAEALALRSAEVTA